MGDDASPWTRRRDGALALDLDDLLERLEEASEADRARLIEALRAAREELGEPALLVVAPSRDLQKTPRPRLTTGGADDPLLAQLAPWLASSQHIDVLSAFVMTSGVAMLEDRLRSALERGARCRLLTGDYLGRTRPTALRRLLSLSEELTLTPEPDDEHAEQGPTGRLELRVIELKALPTSIPSFHPKAWIFDAPGSGCALVGSSNLSRAALGRGVEWNMWLTRQEDPAGFAHIQERFVHLWEQGRAVTRDWIETYTQRAEVFEGSAPRRAPSSEITEEDEALEPLERPTPRSLQREALEALQQHRARGGQRGLIVMATGLGKTWLAAFDVAAFDQEHPRDTRVLLVAHRVELLRQAARTFRAHSPALDVGFFAGDQDELGGQLTLASVQKLTRRDALERIPADAFDYIIVDEVHHAAAPTYRRLLEHFEPSYWLGLTATPTRGDEVHVASLFEDRVVYEAGLSEGIEQGALVPFRYFGLRDTVDYEPIPWRSGRFDPDELIGAVQTQARMERLWGGLAGATPARARWSFAARSPTPPRYASGSAIRACAPAPCTPGRAPTTGSPASRSSSAGTSTPSAPSTCSTRAWICPPSTGW